MLGVSGFTLPVRPVDSAECTCCQTHLKMSFTLGALADQVISVQTITDVLIIFALMFVYLRLMSTDRNTEVLK